MHEVIQERVHFRCPFEKAGQENGSILEIALGEEKSGRLSAIRKAFADFHAAPTNVAIRFTMPASLRAKCSSNQELRTAIVPYQSELLAAELDYRLEPLMPYQMREHGKAKITFAVTTNPGKAMTAAALIEALQVGGLQLPNSSGELSIWIELMFTNALANGIETPNLHMLGSDGRGKSVLLLTIQPSTLVFYTDRAHLKDGAQNKNCFGIVKSPFYPRAFGRWSEMIEIVVSREADFASLATDARRRIRSMANWVHSQHGIVISDLEEDKQPTGVWIPELEK